MKSGELQVLLQKETEVKVAAPCWKCTDAGEEKYGVHAQVYHGKNFNKRNFSKHCFIGVFLLLQPSRRRDTMMHF